jgi:methylenetetrahydrofolate reductase (NADPH)
MKIVEKIQSADPVVSFEFFPPKSQDGVDQLFETVSRLQPHHPAFVSVTYGAGGSTQKLTLELVKRIKRETGIETMAHLTCVGSTQEELRGILDQMQAGGIENVLPLRGDPPKGESQFVVTEGGFAHASELVAFARKNYSFCLAGACYPELHPESESVDSDLKYLKQKVDAGVDVLITQLFFDNQDYFRFVERARAIGITVPIVAGIMPITNVNQIKRFTKMIGASLPEELLHELEATPDSEDVKTIGVRHAVKQCQELLEKGVPGIHFYTLNRSPATVNVLQELTDKGLLPNRH